MIGIMIHIQIHRVLGDHGSPMAGSKRALSFDLPFGRRGRQGHDIFVL